MIGVSGNDKLEITMFENDMLEGATWIFCGNIDRPAHMNVPDDFVANKIFNRTVYATHPSVNYRKGQ